MLASNSASTIFKCMSCSFGTRDHTTYAEHIKHCSNELSTEVAPVASSGKAVQNSLPGKAKRKRRWTSYVCGECHLTTGCSREFLLHQRDVHGHDMEIFACTFCRYAARYRQSIYKHVKRMHPLRALSGRICTTKLFKQSVTPEVLTGKEAKNNEGDISKEQLAPCGQNETSSGTELYPVKSTRSLGLHFLGKRISDVGSYEYFCQLCNFSHAGSRVVGNHIWENHQDKFSEVLAKVSATQVTGDSSVTETLYKCDDCSYSTHTKICFYEHCAKHQFDGPSKCPHCGICALNDASISRHVQKYHSGQHSDDLKVKFSAYRPKNISTKVPASCKVAKTANRYQYAHGTRKWFTCPYCPFRSKWSTSVCHHKARIHTALSKAPGNKSSAGRMPQSKKMKKIDTDEAVEISSSCNKAKQQAPPDESLLPDATSTASKKYVCPLCSVILKSQKCLYAHKQVHLDLRRYQCSVCDLRSNYMANVRTHISKKHKDEKAQVTRLSLGDAKRTIEAYRKQRAGLSHQRSKHMHPSARGKSSELMCPVSYSSSTTSTPSNHLLASSSEDSLLQVKRRRVDSSDISRYYLETSFLSLQKRYACSVCKMQTTHYSSIHRHLRNVHRKAKAIVVKDNMSGQMSKLSLHRKTATSVKLNAGSADGNIEHDASNGMEFAVQHSGKTGHDNNFMSTARDIKSIGDAPVPPSSAEPKVVRNFAFACDICPYTASGINSLVVHRKLHVKRPGYDLECIFCPYFVRQVSHLEYHMHMHAKHADEKLQQKTDFKTRFYLCSLCPFMTTHKNALIYHKQLHRRRASAPHKCDQCAFWVTKAKYLASHARVHTAEYMQRRMEYDQLLQTSYSLGGDAMEEASEKHTLNASHFSASDSTADPDALPVENAATPSKGKLDEMTQNMSVNDRNESTVNGERSVATTQENADVSAHVQSSPSANRQLSTWCCERCPYVTSKVACFKRHTWLHGKQYRYECRYCDYSVQSYWQLVSHVLWHYAPNNHLVYAQPVSSMECFPSQLPNRNSIPDSLASIDRFVPSFESSGVFLLSDVADFQCQHCPFVTEQRSEFFTHMLCHSKHAEHAHSCPYCSFRTDLPEQLSAHILLHFNLPGSRQSSLPPNLRQSEGWKQLEAAIEAVAEKATNNTEPHRILTDNCSRWSRGQAECIATLKADTMVTDTEAVKQSQNEEDQSLAKSFGTLAVVHDEGDSTSALSSAVPQSRESTHGSPSMYSSVNEEHSYADVSDLVKESPLCRYCDRLIDDAAELVKHEAHHLIGFCPTSTGKCMLHYWNFFLPLTSSAARFCACCLTCLRSC